MHAGFEMPKSISLFEKLWLGTLLIGVVTAALTYKQMAGIADPIFIALVQILVLGTMLLLIITALAGACVAFLVSADIASCNRRVRPARSCGLIVLGLALR